uniref:Alternative oxidase n=1 Tax=Ciona savignyi TaxID=51511 RepID=H2YUC5_CIOSA
MFVSGKAYVLRPLLSSYNASCYSKQQSLNYHKYSAQLVTRNSIGSKSLAQFSQKPMNCRWLHSSQQLNMTEKSKHSNSNTANTDPNIEVENFPHFRESQKMKGNLGSSLAESEEHPDIEEAKSMNDGGYRLPHPIWNKAELESVRISHRPPVGKVDKLAYYSVQMLRTGFDMFSGYTLGTYTGRLDEKQWNKRIIFLETIAGVPGMVGAMVRHLVSLRSLKRDHGWIHTLLEEAENERMHLMTAMRVANPGILMKSCIVVAQGIFVSGFSLAYLISPRFCHPVCWVSRRGSC